MAGNFWAESTDMYRDLYLEILREAQRVEDRKLVQLIGKRLRILSQITPATTECCEIILFPGRYTSAAAIPSTAPEATPFWPRFGFRHLLWFFFVYFSLLFTGLML